MLAEHLKGNVMFADRIESWEEAIKLSARPLLEKGCIKPDYVGAMIENVNTNGPYIVILPEVAMPHARHEHGAIETGLTFLQLKEPVMFPENKPVKILMALSAKDSEGHLEMLGELGAALIDREVIENLKTASMEKEVIDIIKSTEE